VNEDAISFKCRSCGKPVDVEFSYNRLGEVRVTFPCSNCGVVGKGARVPLNDPKVSVMVEARAR